MMTLAWPEALLVAVPALWAWWRWGRGPWSGLRLVVLGLLILAATGPTLRRDNGGSDVILVLDRSDSLSPEARSAQEEQIRLVANQRKAGDRLGVVVFGREAALLQAPTDRAVPRLADAVLDGGGSDLAGALALADGLIPPGRSGRVLVISDGEATGRDPRPVVAPLALRNLPVDALAIARPARSDAGIVQIEIPGSLRLGESFIGAVTLRSDTRERRHWQVRRGTRTIAEGDADLGPGAVTPIRFADRPTEPGLARYTILLDATGDARPLDNSAHGAIHVLGGERVLVMATQDTVANALTAAGMTVVKRRPGPLVLDDLLACSAVVLDQIPADSLGPASLRAVASWVRDLGGGLVLGGGRASLGGGGYFRSPIEPILPVSLEVRDDIKRLSTALVLVLDRSGSMAMPAGGGRTKMDLADEGACAAIELLGPTDQVSVIAVDSAPHIVIPMGPATPKEPLIDRTRRIESQGGGIYIEEALIAGGQALASTTSGTRHLLLFADASDSEEPGNYRKILDEFTKAGITVSVIAMGTEQDSDANLLKEIAALGQGRISFAVEPGDIPRLFAQETLRIARQTWIDQAVAPQPMALLPTVAGLDPAFAGAWPVVGGYNLTYARDRAQVLALAPGDPPAPAVASWHLGTGRSAVVGLDLADPSLTAWTGYVPLVAGLARWAAGSGEREPGAVAVDRRGDHLTIRYEVDPTRREAWPTAPPTLRLIGDEDRPAMTMIPVGDGLWEAETHLGEAPVVPAVQVARGDQRTGLVTGPAVQRPMSPEAEPRPTRDDGQRILQDLTRRSGGRLVHDVLGTFTNPPSQGQATPFSSWLMTLALVLAVIEIALRRWRLTLPRWPNRARAAVPTAVEPIPTEPGIGAALKSVRRQR